MGWREAAPYSWRMARNVTQWNRRLKRAAERERLRRMAVEALKAIPGCDLMTWADIARRLNAKGVRNHFGRRWSGSMVCSFVELHAAATGERLVPSMASGAKRRARCLDKGRPVVFARRTEHRQRRAEAIRRCCAGAKTYAEGAQRLNAAGVSTGIKGEWTANDLASFVHRYLREKGVVLMPSVQRGRGWA
jgi:hypothetical protein